jgi:cell wall-associated NlpC family hydrolase
MFQRRAIQPTDGRIAQFREGVRTIALSWIGTPYHHMGRVKGAGVDCAMFPLEVYREAGLIGEVEVPYYPHDWMMHRSEEIFLGIVQKLASELRSHEAAKPGDFVIYKFGRCFAHGAIVLEWPTIIHALTGRGVVLADGEREGILVGRAKKVFRLCAFVIPSGARNPYPHENAWAQ